MNDKFYENNFVPDHLILEMIVLLDRCKCDDCQSEKRKREEFLIWRREKQQVKELKFKK